MKEANDTPIPLSKRSTLTEGSEWQAAIVVLSGLINTEITLKTLVSEFSLSSIEKEYECHQWPQIPQENYTNDGIDFRFS